MLEIIAIAILAPIMLVIWFVGMRTMIGWANAGTKGECADDE